MCHFAYQTLQRKSCSVIFIVFLDAHADNFSFTFVYILKLDVLDLIFLATAREVIMTSFKKILFAITASTPTLSFFLGSGLFCTSSTQQSKQINLVGLLFS